MTTRGEDVGDLLRRVGEEALVHEAESAGLSPRAGRVRCPWPACEHKGPGRERDAVIFAAGHPRIHCYACGQSGDLVDLLCRTRGWSNMDGLTYLRGLAVPDRPRPELRVVVGRTPPDDSGKLTPADAKRTWDGLAQADDIGMRYLEGRHLDAAVGMGLVRFAKDDCPDKSLANYARRGYRVAVCLYDVVGNARGMQLRLAGEAKAKETKILSLKGSLTSRAFFGSPDAIEGAPVVVVAEGMADTLAAALWADGAAVVVGAAGKGFLPRLAEELEAAGIDVHGKLFALLPQNDRPTNASRREFVRLSQLLQARGARVCFVRTPDEYKDVAEWHSARPETEWPPAELAQAFGREPGDESEAKSMVPAGCAVPLPTKVRTDRYAQDFTTLCALLDDGASREAVMGAGELTWCEMTHRVRVGGRPMSDSDYTSARFGLEGQGLDGKRLKWGEEDISKALTMLARRKTVHPVRDWLRGLTWDEVHRLEVGVPEALGFEAGGFQARLLKRWFISAVARPMRPGCKVDTVLVLVGQGRLGKSTFFAALAGDFFTDSPVRVDDKDGALVMREAWIVEWGELEAMKRAKDYEAIKAFLSSREDWYRPPYGRSVVKVPRHSVIVGTFSSGRQFVGDAVDSRRFWPLEVSRVDVEWVREWREQLWAEAVALFDAGDQWWLTPEEDAQLLDALREHEVVDAWTDPITNWLDDNRLADRVTTAQLLHLALDKKMHDWTSGDEKRVVSVLRQLGWNGPRRERIDSMVRRVFIRPVVAP